jgi:hypothetical protein
MLIVLLKRESTGTSRDSCVLPSIFHEVAQGELTFSAVGYLA